MNYHVNPESGKTGKSKAAEKCPFGEESHWPEEAGAGRR